MANSIRSPHNPVKYWGWLTGPGSPSKLPGWNGDPSLVQCSGSLKGLTLLRGANVATTLIFLGMSSFCSPLRKIKAALSWMMSFRARRKPSFLTNVRGQCTTVLFKRSFEVNWCYSWLFRLILCLWFFCINCLHAVLGVFFVCTHRTYILKSVASKPFDGMEYKYLKK